MSSATTGNLVTVQQAIEAHKKSSNGDGSCGRNVFVDGSWHMPSSPRNGRSEFKTGPRVPGAVYFDIDDVADAKGLLPHMMPSSHMFARAMDRMGISHHDVVYVYAAPGCAFSHRAYWTFAYTGYHDPAKVKLVQGSILDEWEEGELEHGVLAEEDDDDDDGDDKNSRLFRVGGSDWENETPKYVCWKGGRSMGDDWDDTVVVDMDRMLSTVIGGTGAEAGGGTTSEKNADDVVVVDARSSGRFYGTEPEPRPGLRGGHMPGSVNVPFMSLLDPDDPTLFRPMEEVREIFVGSGIAPLEEDEEGAGGGGGGGVPRRVVCTCGSGVTAAALAVGLEECGLRRKEDISIYDGSWIEWGGDDDTPIVTAAD